MTDDDSDAARDDDSPPQADITPWASRRVRFGIFVALYCVTICVAAVVSQQIGPYVWGRGVAHYVFTANNGAVGVAILSKYASGYLLYADDQ